MEKEAFKKAVADAETGIYLKLKVEKTTSDSGENVFLELFRRNNIRLPRKMRRWVNTAMAEICFRHSGDISYCYYSGSKDNPLIAEYLRELEEKISGKFSRPEEEKLREYAQDTGGY